MNFAVPCYRCLNADAESEVTLALDVSGLAWRRYTIAMAIMHGRLADSKLCEAGCLVDGFPVLDGLSFYGKWRFALSFILPRV